MIALGVHAYGHDTAAAIVKDGKLLFAVEEERLTRKKHCTDFPIMSINACLRFAGVGIEDIGALCISVIPSKQIQLKFLRYWLDSFPKANMRMAKEFETVAYLLNIEKTIREKLNFNKEIFYCHHHSAHMASAFYLSNFETSALYSIDGVGEIESSVIGLGKNNSINLLEEFSLEWPTSIGALYTATTAYLGFLPHCDEGKVMGLGPCGNVETFKKVFEDIVQFEEKGRYAFNLEYLEYPFKTKSDFSEKFYSICGPRRTPKTEITQRHKDIAAGLQYITEKAMLHTADHLFKITQNKNLCLAGGVALNCVSNGKILSQTSFENIFVQPAANDSGSAIGAALFYYMKNGKGIRHSLDNTFLGNFYSDEEVESHLKEKNISYNRSHEIIKETAKLLAKGKIIGWFNGRMEFGPRALGNRSIITAPFPLEMKDILNEKVKHRESFRPFAPAVRMEDCPTYFDSSHESPYMLLTYKVKKDQIEKIPAITHVDETARVQTVTYSQNPSFYKLISEFKELTGIGVLLNTSFNVMGQPIVNTPAEAVDCFLSTQMDYLILNTKFIIEKR